MAAALAGDPPEHEPRLGATTIFGALIRPPPFEAEAAEEAARRIAAADVDMAASSVSGLSLISLPQAQQEAPESMAASFVQLSDAAPAAHFSSESSNPQCSWGWGGEGGVCSAFVPRGGGRPERVGRSG